MKGQLWKVWMFGLIAAFIVVMAFFVFTPFVESTMNAAKANTNFTATINESVTDTYDTLQTYWGIWPVAMIAMVMLIWFIVATDDEQRIRR